MEPIKLGKKHIAAVNRRRRVILNYDAIGWLQANIEGDELVQSMFGAADIHNSPVDAMWMNWGENNFALYDSDVIETYGTDEADAPFQHHRYERWRKEGFDIIGLCNEGAKNRDIESFFSYRINGSDSDFVLRIPKFKKEHPEMCLYDEASSQGRASPMYNFVFGQVRNHKLLILDEAFTLWDFDGVEIDFARACPCLPSGNAWTQRWALTTFMRDLRVMLQKAAAKRGHPILISARVPETLAGCHFDGLDVREWIASGLVDILTLGCRTFEVEYLAFQKIAAEYPVKLYPCIDDVHATDGYQSPPIEVFRGVVDNFMAQGFEGLQTFNFQNPEPSTPTHTSGTDLWTITQWALHKAFYEEIGSGAIATRKKTWVIQRRFGGRRDFSLGYPGKPIGFRPWEWKTPRNRYCNTNVEAQLPAILPADRDHDLFLHLYVGTVPETANLCVLMSSGESTIEVRINNVLVPGEQKGVAFVCDDIDDDVLAQGDNLIGLSLVETDPDVGFSLPEPDRGIWVEKVELREHREPEPWEPKE